jgi:hypothetical protein
MESTDNLFNTDDDLKTVIEDFKKAIKDNGEVDGPLMITNTSKMMARIYNNIIDFVDKDINRMNSERRKGLIAIIDKYGTLLNKTGKFVVPAQNAANNVKYTLEQLLEIWENETNESRGLEMLKDVQWKPFHMEDLPTLQTEFIELLGLIQAEMVQVENDKKIADKKFKLCVGIALGAVVFAIAAAVTGGLAVAGVGVFGAVGAATVSIAGATVGASTLGMATTTSIGALVGGVALGGAAFFATAAVSASVAANLYRDLGNDLKKLNQYYSNVKSGINQVSTSLDDVKDSMEILNNDQESTPTDSWRKFKYTATKNRIIDAQNENNKLLTAIASLRVELEKQRSNYKSDLISVQHELQTTSSNGCIIM